MHDSGASRCGIANAYLKLFGCLKKNRKIALASGVLKPSRSSRDERNCVNSQEGHKKQPRGSIRHDL
jgi:hypothetical protein